MITNTKQKWEIGQTIKVGFLTLKIIDIKSIKDGLPDIYILENLKGTKQYRFIPYNGLEAI